MNFQIPQQSGGATLTRSKFVFQTLAKMFREKFRPSDTPDTVRITWIKRDATSWLGREFPGSKIKLPSLDAADRIEKIASRTQELGPKPLWEGYIPVYQKDPSVPFSGDALLRQPKQVRPASKHGLLFSMLARRRDARIIVEFGSAFGVSGMYWASGLSEGRLLTFEPNQAWQPIAKKNLEEVSPLAISILGTFEDNIDHQLKPGETIDIGFVDAIHTSDFVNPQIEIVISHLTPKGLIILDDIDFSDDMRECWEKWASDPRVASSFSVDGRLGILEMAN